MANARRGPAIVDPGPPSRGAIPWRRLRMSASASGNNRPQGRSRRSPPGEWPQTPSVVINVPVAVHPPRAVLPRTTPKPPPQFTCFRPFSQHLCRLRSAKLPQWLNSGRKSGGFFDYVQLVGQLQRSHSCPCDHVRAPFARLFSSFRPFTATQNYHPGQARPSRANS